MEKKEIDLFYNLKKIILTITILQFFIWTKSEGITKIIKEKIPVGYIEENLPLEWLEIIKTKGPEITILVEPFKNKETNNKKNPLLVGEMNVSMPYGVLVVPIPQIIPVTTLKFKHEIESFENPEKLIPAILIELLNKTGIKTKSNFEYQPVDLVTINTETKTTIFTPAQFLLLTKAQKIDETLNETQCILKGEIDSFWTKTEISQSLPSIFTGFKTPLPNIKSTEANCKLNLKLEDKNGNTLWTETYSHSSKIANPSYILTQTINKFLMDINFWKALDTLDIQNKKFEDLSIKTEIPVKKEGKKKVIIFPFVDISGRPSLQSVYFNQLNRILKENGHEVVVEDSLDIFLRKEVDPFSLPKKETIKNLKKSVDADFVVICEIQKVKDITAKRRAGGLIGTMMGLKIEEIVGEEWLIGGGVINLSNFEGSCHRTYIRLETDKGEELKLSYEKEDLLSNFFLLVLVYLMEN